MSCLSNIYIECTLIRENYEIRNEEKKLLFEPASYEMYFKFEQSGSFDYVIEYFEIHMIYMLMLQSADWSPYLNAICEKKERNMCCAKRIS